MLVVLFSRIFIVYKGPSRGLSLTLSGRSSEVGMKLRFVGNFSPRDVVLHNAPTLYYGFGEWVVNC